MTIIGKYAHQHNDELLLDPAVRSKTKVDNGSNLRLRLAYKIHQSRCISSPARASLPAMYVKSVEGEEQQVGARVVARSYGHAYIHIHTGMKSRNVRAASE